jgi:uncharacterized protein (TIGR04562 family)
VDKDLRQNYVSTIQMQIFDRIYRYINRDDEDRLFLQAKGEKAIELADFQTKSKKSRDSIIIKLLHKKENVAEQLFDRIGVRFITYTKFDCMRVIKFLCDHNIIMVHNIKPSRSHNSLIDFHQFKSKYKDYLESIKEAQIDQKEFYQQAEKICNECLVEDTQNIENKHSFTDYRAIHFTARQLIRYVNPFMNEFRKLREEAKSLENLPIAQKILKLDTSSVSNMIRFFYPFEVQITDKESHFKNTEGEASHTEYKKSQLESAKNRLFSVLLKNRKS